MAENLSLTNLANLQNDATATGIINSNNAAITTAFTDVLSRSGVVPNQMTSNLDMNNNQIINLPTPGSNFSPVRLIDVGTINSGGITVSPLPAGGTTNQVLMKNSGANYDAGWKSISLTTIYTPEMFGAKGDNVTDDTAAINSAVSAASTNKGIVFLTSTYKITSTINITNPNISIVGLGNGSGLWPTAGITAISVSIPTRTSVVLRDFSINYASAVANQIGILHQCSNASLFTGPSLFENLYIGNASTCISLVNFQGPNGVMGCWLENFLLQGVLITAPANVDGGDFPIEGNLIGSNAAGAVGISWQSGGGVRIINNKFTGSMLIGVDISLQTTGLSSLAMITQNSFEGMTVCGIRFIRANTTAQFVNVIINGNEFEIVSPGTGGIVIQSDAGSSWVTNFNAINNIMYQGSDLTFISIAQTTGFLISHNILRSGGNSKIVNAAATCDQGVIGPNAKSGTTAASTISSTNTTTISPT